MPLYNFTEAIIDNYLRDKVDEPVLGSVVYCDLAFGYAEHSGIYIGNGKIAHLNKYGCIEAVTPKEFIDGTTAISIYVSCSDFFAFATGSDEVAERAKSMLGCSRDYNVILDNCHQFSAGCLTGNFENANIFLWMVKDEAKKVILATKWRVWDL
ncbi:lecithin retinol acyltransferase family protein [Plesiomonas shigelloides]|nr:lecithin retinol acyltransferase family protein [Plesiomonas shigelloides]